GRQRHHHHHAAIDKGMASRNCGGHGRRGGRRPDHHLQPALYRAVAGFAGDLTSVSPLFYSSPTADHDIVFGLTSDGRIEASRVSADLRLTPVASLPRPYGPAAVLHAFSVGGQPHVTFESRQGDFFAEVLRLDGSVLT